MSDPRNVGCLQARKSLVKLSKARFPNRGTEDGISLFDKRNKAANPKLGQQLKNHMPCIASPFAPPSTEYNILWLKNDYLCYCSSTNRHTKNFFIRKKSFSFDFLYCYLEWHRIPKRGGKPIISPIGILELGLAEKYEHWYIFSALMQQWVGISFGCKALD